MKDKRFTPLTAKIFLDQFKLAADAYPNAVIIVKGVALSQASYATSNPESMELFLRPVLKK